MNFIEILKKLKKFKLYWKIKEYFIIGTWQSFLLHIILLWSNIFLFILMIAEFFFHNNTEVMSWFVKIELFFGIIYLIENLIRLVYIAIPNTISGGTFVILNFTVIASLIVPQVFGNLAILRIIRSLKIIKIFYFRKELKEDKEIIKNGE